MPARDDFSACQACRKLKRKCSKEIPTCLRCLRLRRTCVYGLGSDQSRNPSKPGLAKAATGVRQNDALWNPVTPIQPAKFPSSIFLDPETFIPVRDSYFQIPDDMLVRLKSLAFDQAETIEHYSLSVHNWLPILSLKRLNQGSASSKFDGSLHLLLSSIRLLVDTNRSSEDNDYLHVRRCCFDVESAGCLNLRLLQSIVLLAVYEYGNAIYPNAYLTTGRARRIGQLMGLHDSGQSPRLLAEPETWTICEERRRVWWAVILLETTISLASPGLPLAFSDFTLDTLLPVNDLAWSEGYVVPSEALLTSDFYASSALGSFARTCQASHLLGKVLHHAKLSGTAIKSADILEEASALESMLTAFSKSLTLETSFEEGNVDEVGCNEPFDTARSICIAAQLFLYNQYACNEPSRQHEQSRSSAEVQMQAISLNGIKVLASREAAKLASDIVSKQHGAQAQSPWMIYTLYHAATECAWFIKEVDDPVHVWKAAMHQVVEALRILGQNWRLAKTYLQILETNESKTA